MSATEKVTITLPADLMAAVRTLAPARRQSQFIAEAIRAYIAEQERNTLRERLIAGYQANAAADAELTAKWLSPNLLP
jgi:metal-responsive CopG/Arc/MetJ family transcriptional regulator